MPRLVEIGPVVPEKKIFKFHQCIFAICVIISPCKRAGPFIWTNLNPLQPRMLCAKFGWKWTNDMEFWRWKWKKFTDRLQTTSNQRSSLKNHATLLSQFLHYVMWYVVYSNKKHLSIISQLNLFPKHASQSGTKSILTKHLSSKYVAINNSTSSTRYRK